jgi:predicted nucleic acid-binding protein
LIYLDSSVALAALLAENRSPAGAFWDKPLTSSRLLQYEVWTRINARSLGREAGDAANALLDRLAFVELTAVVLERALEPFPLPVRTLDALHLASMEFLRSRGQDISLASYDARLIAAAQALRIPITPLS